MWDLPGPGLEPMSPALAGGFLTTVPPGKSSCLCFWTCCSLPEILYTSSAWKTHMQIPLLSDVHPHPISPILWHELLPLLCYDSTLCRPLLLHIYYIVFVYKIFLIRLWTTWGKSLLVIFLFTGFNKYLLNWILGSESIKSIKYNLERGKRESTFINYSLYARPGTVPGIRHYSI